MPYSKRIDNSNNKTSDIMGITRTAKTKNVKNVKKKDTRTQQKMTTTKMKSRNSIQFCSKNCFSLFLVNCLPYCNRN